MKHFPSDKYNLAWFKLAECVSRGEKERALGVYRLLSYSISDKAYALKLEGDILFAFKDSLATQRYQAALTAYCSQGRLREAAAISEYLITLNDNDRDLLEQLFALYKQLGNQKKIVHSALLLMMCLLKQADFTGLEELIKNHLDTIPQDYQRFFKGIVVRYIQNEHAPRQLGFQLVAKMLDCLCGLPHAPELQQFLCELEAINHEYYNFALDYMSS